MKKLGKELKKIHFFVLLNFLYYKSKCSKNRNALVFVLSVRRAAFIPFVLSPVTNKMKLITFHRQNKKGVKEKKNPAFFCCFREEVETFPSVSCFKTHLPKEVFHPTSYREGSSGRGGVSWLKPLTYSW